MNCADSGAIVVRLVTLLLLLLFPMVFPVLFVGRVSSQTVRVDSLYLCWRPAAPWRVGGLSLTRTRVNEAAATTVARVGRSPLMCIDVACPVGADVRSKSSLCKISRSSSAMSQLRSITVRRDRPRRPRSPHRLRRPLRCFRR